MTQEVIEFMNEYTAASPRVQSIIKRILYVLNNGTEEARQIMLTGADAKTIGQLLEILKEAEAVK